MALPGAAGLVVYAVILRKFFPATWVDVRMLTSRLARPTAPRATGSAAREKRDDEEAGAEQGAAELSLPKGES